MKKTSTTTSHSDRYTIIVDKAYDGWYAIDDQRYDVDDGQSNCYLGWGKSKWAAIRDLIENMEENDA